MIPKYLSRFTLQVNIRQQQGAPLRPSSSAARQRQALVKITRLALALTIVLNCIPPDPVMEDQMASIPTSHGEQN